jgi:hypothetical protein
VYVLVFGGLMEQITGREIADFSLTLRDLAHLPWRKVTSDAQSRPTQYRCMGTVHGLSMTIVEDITYYADNDANFPGYLKDKTFTVTGPDQNTAHNNRIIKFSPVYDVTTFTKIGEDVSIDGVALVYS